MEKVEIKRVHNNISVYYNNQLIEQYKLTEAIDFKGLMKLLIADELTNKFEYKIEDGLKLNDEEQTLISIIENIIDEYNGKINEFNEFVQTLKND